MKRFIFGVCLIAGLIFFGINDSAFCSEPSETSSEQQEIQGARIGVMPFLVGKPDGSVDEAVEKTLSCPLSQLCDDKESVRTGADAVLTRFANKELGIELQDNLVPLKDMMAASETLRQAEEVETVRSLAKKYGQAVHAQKILVGIVWRFRSRGETADSYSGTSPASVAFAVYLVDVATGKREWRGIFDQTQRTLTEDILGAKEFFKTGVKWLSAEELARIGVKRVFRTFPYAQFLR